MVFENCKSVDILDQDQASTSTNSSDLDTSTTSMESPDLKCDPTFENYPLAIKKLDNSFCSTGWFIKALVVQKSDIRTYSTFCCNGKFFTLELYDESGFIRVVCFNEVCDMFYSVIQANKVYYFGNCGIGYSNRKYNSLPHDYELYLKKYSRVEPCNESETKIEPPPVKLWTLSEIVHHVGQCDLKLEMFRVQALVLEIEEDDFVYEACPSAYCNKKVVRCLGDVDELYHCVKCNATYPSFQYRYMLKVKITDSSGFLQITLFDEAERFLNISAHDLTKMREANHPDYKRYFTRRVGEIYTFTLQVGLLAYSNAVYVNAVGDSFFPIDSKRSSLSSLPVTSNTERDLSVLTIF